MTFNPITLIKQWWERRKRQKRLDALRKNDPFIY
jgi:hypothetical protein